MPAKSFYGIIILKIRLARMLHEGNEVQGKCGKQGLSIARRCIAIAMDQGGSAKIGSQIYPEFVQVQTVNFIMPKFRL